MNLRHIEHVINAAIYLVPTMKVLARKSLIPTNLLGSKILRLRES